MRSRTFSDGWHPLLPVKYYYTNKPVCHIPLILEDTRKGK